MNPQIQNLVKAQELDLERARVARDLTELPAQIKVGEAALASAVQAKEHAEKALAEEETLRAKLDQEIAKHRQKAARLRVQLDSVTTQAQAEAMEREIQFAEQEAGRLETEAFASLERTELQAGAQAEATARAAEETEALAKINARCAERKQQYAAELARLTEERDALRMAVLLADEALLTRYDKIAAARKTGLARAENQQCVGCRMAIRLQMWNELREGALLTCESCGRMLYWDPAVFAGAETKSEKR